MNIERLATILLLIVAYWNTHRAGVAYILAKDQPKIRQFAIARSVFSALLMILVVSINW